MSPRAVNEINRMSRKVLLLLLWLLPCTAPAVRGEWIRGWRYLDNVSLEEHSGNDGDSFHARRNRSRYLLRLYFVDTPETDRRFPDRLQEQADYFGVSVDQVVEGGKMADAFTRSLLEKGPFDVYTKYVDARGSSAMNRIFAMVKVDGRWLCERLVEAGLARIHGFWDDLPDGTSSRLHSSRLRSLENTARREKRGIWGMNSPEARLVRAGGRVTLTRETPIYSLTPPYPMVGQLPEGWEVLIGEKHERDYWHVSFTSPGGNEFRGLIHEQFIPE
jgi:endonuclease YncB( thermonuclease family)